MAASGSLSTIVSLFLAGALLCTGCGGDTILPSGDGSDPTQSEPDQGHESGTGGEPGIVEGMPPAGGSPDVPAGAGGEPVDMTDPTVPAVPPSGNAADQFTTYEAEDAEFTGVPFGPTRELYQVATEASGRRFVRLQSTGDNVRFSVREPADALVVRYSIPDQGHDNWRTLSVYVDGEFRQKISVTSRWSWTYGDEQMAFEEGQEDPSNGLPHHFFDEARAIIGAVEIGQVVELRRDGDDTASHYDIDFIELESAGDPLPQPEGSLHLINDCGATANDETDDASALQSCFEWAAESGRAVYIPAGVFRLISPAQGSQGGQRLEGVNVTGAGVWHAELSGRYAFLDCHHARCNYSDFAIFGDTLTRFDSGAHHALTGPAPITAERLWVEHTTTGYWPWREVTGTQILRSRFRNLMADGLNLYAGAQHALVEGNHFRNTGDDAMAAWSQFEGGGNLVRVNEGNVFRNNFVQIPWKASCMAIYGGNNTLMEGNLCVDVVQHSGILIKRHFGSHPFGGLHEVRNNRLVRAGGFSFGQIQGAVKLSASEAEVENVLIEDLLIESPTYVAIHTGGPHWIGNVTLRDIAITDPGEHVFYNQESATGFLNTEQVVATGAPAGVRDESEGAMNIIRGAGVSGW